jgi:hypothetical protein
MPLGYSMRTVNSNRIQLLSPLTPAECVSRLTAVIDTERLASSSWSGSRPVVGRVTDSSLRLRKRIRYRNSFQSFLTATMRPEAGGTLISGEVAMHPFVRAFMLIWLSGVLFIGGTMFLATVGSMAIASGSHHQNAWMGVVIPPVMLAFGFGLVCFGRYLARDEGRFLTDFLSRTLDVYEQN